MTEHVFRTTRGQAHLRDGRIVISFGYLDDSNKLYTLTLDVDAYAKALLRDLASAVCEQGDSEGIA